MKRRATQKIEDEVLKLQQPESMSKTQWRGVKAYLLAIARHYPKAYPNQQTLAEEVGRDVRSIRAYQHLAVGAGLLLVKPDAGRRGDKHTWSRTHQYLILIPEAISGAIPEIFPINPTGTTYPPGGELRSPLPVGEGELEAPDPACGRMSRFYEEPARQVGKNPEPPAAPAKSAAKRPGGVKAESVLPPGHNRRGVKKDPPAPRGPRRLVNYFIQKWSEMTQDPAVNEVLRDITWDKRIVENLGAAERYVSVTFLADDALQPQTVGQVQVLIDQFVEAVKRGDVSMRREQSAWQAFTGMWGKTELRLDEDEAARRYFGDNA